MTLQAGSVLESRWVGGRGAEGSGEEIVPRGEPGSQPEVRPWPWMEGQKDSGLGCGRVQRQGCGEPSAGSVTLHFILETLML